MKPSFIDSGSVCLTQARDAYGHVHRHVAKLLRTAGLSSSALTDQQSSGQTQGANVGCRRKPAHTLLPEEEYVEIPVHGPDGR